MKKDLQKIKFELKALFPKGMLSVFDALRKLLAEDSLKLQKISLFQIKLNAADKKRLKNEIDDEALIRVYNNVREALMAFVNDLELADLSRLESIGEVQTSTKQGELLYKIPEQMTLLKETKCIIRIAYDDIQILKDLEVNEDVTSRPLDRISEVMQVTLNSQRDDAPFKIRTINEAEQVVLKEGYTEWIFYVKPLRVGNYALQINVAVILLRNNMEKKKETIFEEEIKVTTKETPEEILEAPLKRSNAVFVIGDNNTTAESSPSGVAATAASSRGQVPRNEIEKLVDGAIPSPPRSKLIKLKLLRNISLVTGMLTLVVSAWYVSLIKDDNFSNSPNNIELVSADGPVTNRIRLEQGWDETPEDFWFTSHGARLMPYSWYLVLEQDNNQKLFRSSANMERLGYLPQESSQKNPGGLPIGFAITRPVDGVEPAVGFTCAACHTNQLNYKGKKLLIEGAPTLANFVLFYSDLIKAMQQTLKDDAKFERFAKGVLKENDNANAVANLRTELSLATVSAAERQTVNALPASYPPDFTSYARLDAFGNIANASSAFGIHDLGNKNSPTGPVSYPFLWGTHQSDVVQWNASAPNTPVVGPLIRNVGEVLGFFGELSITEATWWQKLVGINVTYKSSVDFEGLAKLQTLIKELRSPEWPEDVFPPIDLEKAARGAMLFTAHCQHCHQIIPRHKEGENYIANKTLLTEIGTDPIAAWNMENHTAKTGILEGVKEQLVLGDTFGLKAKAMDVTFNGALGIVLNNPNSALKAGLAPGSLSVKDGKPDLISLVKENIERRKELDEHIYTDEMIDFVPPPALGSDGRTLDLDNLVYKGRPLNGIWATAPYLHNGSVPNLWELLQVPQNRVKTFKVGSREFQADVVGYITDEGPSTFNVLDTNGKIMPGNSNLGHWYGTGLSDDEKWDLIEYIKTL